VDPRQTLVHHKLDNGKIVGGLSTIRACLPRRWWPPRNISVSPSRVPSLQEHPFNFARKVSTLDHLSKGRLGWNIVTSVSHNAVQLG
jgi:hypothetical protein